MTRWLTPEVESPDPRVRQILDRETERAMRDSHRTPEDYKSLNLIDEVHLFPPEDYEAVCSQCESPITEKGWSCGHGQKWKGKIRFENNPDFKKDDLDPAFIIAYGFVAVSGFLLGCLLMWGVMR